MAARAIWKGYLRLSLVNCAVALFPTTTQTSKIHFHKMNAKTGNRLRMRMVDEETGDEVPTDEQVRGYEIAKGESVVIDPDDIDKIALESTHLLEITSFTPRDKIDPVYFDKTYFLAAEDKPSEEAFGVIRQAMVRKKIAALSKVVLHDREHIVLLEPRGAGMLATMMHWPYEMHDEKEALGGAPKQVKADEDLLEVADTLVDRKMADFDPSTFKDQYEEALKSMVEAKRAGKKLTAPRAPDTTRVTDIMEALKASLAQTRSPDRKGGKQTPASGAARKKAPARSAAPTKRKAKG